MAVEKFLGEALLFPVNGQQESVDSKWIEESVTFEDRVYRGESFLILKFREDGEDVVLANGQAIQGGRGSWLMMRSVISGWSGIRLANTGRDWPRPGAGQRAIRAGGDNQTTGRRFLLSKT